ncbi:MAG TPA: RlpA-like double-psi beta-barrel domain-containing protein [Actinomycetota bacterium]
MRTKAAALTVALATTLVAAPVAASPLDQELDEARANRATALARLAQLERQLEPLLVRYSALERQAGRASIWLVEATLAERAAEALLAVAQEQLDLRARAAYQLGPGAILEAMLTARTFADVAAASEYTAQTLSLDAEAVEAKRAAEALLQRERAAAALARARLALKQAELATLLSAMRAKVAEAQALADRAGVVVASLEEKQQAIQDAAGREIGRNLLGGGATGKDQSALLALLGPTGGRTCTTPEGLLDTGKGFSGLATSYGWEFAGQGTANGAIFDPRLFTAANRWLPFGTFLKVHYGGKCAIVLVNDRGPYGDLDRVIDLAMAPAQYLGIGVSKVRADILVSVGGIPN